MVLELVYVLFWGQASAHAVVARVHLVWNNMVIVVRFRYWRLVCRGGSEVVIESGRARWEAGGHEDLAWDALGHGRQGRYEGRERAVVDTEDRLRLVAGLTGNPFQHLRPRRPRRHGVCPRGRPLLLGRGVHVIGFGSGIVRT